MKYKLGEEHPEFPFLKRVIYLRDIPRYGVKAGDKGGWIEYEHNLSQEGDCVVLHNSYVYGNALVRGNARVYDNPMVYENAQVHGNAQVSGDARVYGNSNVSTGAIDSRLPRNSKINSILRWVYYRSQNEEV